VIDEVMEKRRREIVVEVLKMYSNTKHILQKYPKNNSKTYKSNKSYFYNKSKNKKKIRLSHNINFKFRD